VCFRTRTVLLNWLSRWAPFFCVLETPGSGNVVRVVNTAPIEFPMTASVVPMAISEDMSTGAVLGGDVVLGGGV